MSIDRFTHSNKFSILKQSHIPLSADAHVAQRDHFPDVLEQQFSISRAQRYAEEFVRVHMQLALQFTADLPQCEEPQIRSGPPNMSLLRQTNETRFRIVERFQSHRIFSLRFLLVSRFSVDSRAALRYSMNEMNFKITENGWALDTAIDGFPASIH